MNQSNLPLTSTRKNFHQERTTTGPAIRQEEMNSHNMKTITRAKLKTLKLTALIGKKTLNNICFFFILILVICFILCWTPYYCIVFFLIITDDPIDHENSQKNSIDRSSIDQSTHNERSFLIVLMLAVANSVLDPLIYGNFQLMIIIEKFGFPFKVVLWSEQLNPIGVID